MPCIKQYWDMVRELTQGFPYHIPAYVNIPVLTDFIFCFIVDTSVADCKSSPVDSDVHLDSNPLHPNSGEPCTDIDALYLLAPCRLKWQVTEQFGFHKKAISVELYVSHLYITKQ